MSKDKVNNACWECGVSANVLTCLKKYNQPPKQLAYSMSTFHLGVCDWCGEKKEVTEARDFFHPDFSLLEQNRENRLATIIHDILWMAARYAHGRHTFAPHTIREAVKEMQLLFPDWKPRKDTIIKPREEDEEGGFDTDWLDDIFNPTNDG